MRHFILFLFSLGLLMGCQTAVEVDNGRSTPAPEIDTPAYQNADLPIPERVDDLLARMTLAEKVGQMTLIEKESLSPEDVTTYFLGGVLSGGGGSPPRNTVENWAEMTGEFQAAALDTPLQIPILYGVDAVHGHGNLAGATIFPHNIGLGAADNPDLMREIGAATALEALATGANWNYAPVLAVPQDIRWGRTYEAYGSDPELVARLGLAYFEGLQGEEKAAELRILATPKHFVADGATAFGSQNSSGYLIDQGDAQISEEELRQIHIAPYIPLIGAGAKSIMVSFSSWQGTKMHASEYLLTEVLKDELGFEGFLVSDWAALDQIAPNQYDAAVLGINAGIDMVMVPYNAELFISATTMAVENGDISLERIDDAVRRILTVKFEMGLFENRYPNPDWLDSIRQESHLALARQAVQESAVLLKNSPGTLPVSADAQLIFVAGEPANDIGYQTGGWTLEWQGVTNQRMTGSTLLDGIEDGAGENTDVRFNRFGNFERVTDAAGEPAIADVGIVVLAEDPYAEGLGDREDLSLSEQDISLIERMRVRSDKLIVVLYAGRPLVLTEQLDHMDALIMAWLPGSEGAALADLLFGATPFVGTLPISWPLSNDQLPLTTLSNPTSACDAPLFPLGYGLSSNTTDELQLPDCS